MENQKTIETLWKPSPGDPFLSELTRLTFGLRPVFRLRWRFELKDGQIILGGWNNPTAREAWSIKKEGLRAAMVEVEHQAGWGILTALEVSGQDYASMQWVQAQSLVIGGKGRGKSDIIGLSILTRIEKFTALIDGRVMVRPLTDHEIKFKIKEHKV